VPGGKFPPERELAKDFGVNRGSLRQALKVLEIMGVLAQRQGDGTYLSTSADLTLKEPLDFLVLVDDISHHELFETRMIVEPELASRAAQRATAEDLIGLRKAILAMERCRTNQERLDADLAFHECIFRASGNRICHLLFRVIHRNLLTSMSKLSTRVPLDRPLTFHKRIYAAIQSRDSEEARRQMLDHIADTKTLLNVGNQDSRAGMPTNSPVQPALGNLTFLTVLAKINQPKICSACKTQFSTRFLTSLP